MSSTPPTPPHRRRPGQLPVPPAYDEMPPTDPPTQAFGTRTSGTPAPPPAEPEPPRRGLVPTIALAVLVLAAVAAAAIMFLGGEDDDPGSTGTSSTTASGEDPSTSGSGGDSTASSAGSSTTAGPDDTAAPPEDALSAEETVEAYFAALADRDCEALIGYVSEASWSEGGSLSREQALAACEEDQAGASEYSLDSVEVTEGGGEQDEAAVAEVTVTADDESTTTPIHLVREDGVWKIDFTQV